MPKNPAASQIGTPRCISQVAAVWRKVCGVTLPARWASPTAVLNPFLTEATGLPLNSTKQLAISLRSFQRRRWARSSRRYRRRRLTFLSGPPADLLPVEHATLKVDK